MGRKIVIKGICALSIYIRNNPWSMRGAATDVSVPSTHHLQKSSCVRPEEIEGTHNNQ